MRPLITEPINGLRCGKIVTNAVCKRCDEPRGAIFQWDPGNDRTWSVPKCDAWGGRLDSFDVFPNVDDQLVDRRDAGDQDQW